VAGHRRRALNPDRPFIRGTAQNPDVYFQGRETVNNYYTQTPAYVADAMARFGERTGRKYNLFEYSGHPEAERVIVIMGSGGETVSETVNALADRQEKCGVVQVRLFRPFDTQSFVRCFPGTVKTIAVLDRTKEPGAIGEPLYQDVMAAFVEQYHAGGLPGIPKVIGGRYGLSSKEFTPAMVKAVFDELKNPSLRNHFTIGIHDDLSHTSLTYDPSFTLDESNWRQAIFYGLGADGTVGANKNSIKIIGENTPLHAQGYFVYDSKKSGARTISHLRFGRQPIRAPYLIGKADFVACHQFQFLDKVEMLHQLKVGGVFLLNAPYTAGELWDKLPARVQLQIIEKGLKLYAIDANRVARMHGMGTRINTIMQTCFFALAQVLPKEEAIAQIKASIEKTYAKKGTAAIARNFEAVDATLQYLFELAIPANISAAPEEMTIVSDKAPEFVKKVIAPMLAGHGDDLPVSAISHDGTWPSGTTQWEKRNISEWVPAWEPDLCIQCGNCAFVCPHSVIRAKFYHEKFLEKAPAGFQSAPINARGFPETRYSLQVNTEDCTGCTLCVEVCPATDPLNKSKKAINMDQKENSKDDVRLRTQYFENIPWNDRSRVNFSTIHGTQFLEPLFEFSGACAGCGETPYLKLLSQLFGDRLLVANATGCSSIYGGNLPTTPWTINKEGRGPAWSNSLFEDNAEFGLGMRISSDMQHQQAVQLLKQLDAGLDENLVDQLLNAPQESESQIAEQRQRLGQLKEWLSNMDTPQAKQLLSVADHLVKRSVWLVGGDGWAYDIGYGGLDHVLASGRNVNILVLDTEVYSNTGGQSSKATPTAATAKFAAAGKRVAKKDLAMQAISYGNVYVAKVAFGANPQQTLLAMREAEAYPGPSLILAYSHCIAHGYDMKDALSQQQRAVQSAYWPLLRYNPATRKKKLNPFILDSPRPTISLSDYAYQELRYKMLQLSHPEEAEKLMQMSQEIVNLRWKNYEELATRQASDFVPVA
jgi:pyruvate-ferredoxin/flavodoxin oxidoreductase